MPDLKVTIGGRNFKVACDPGEELDVKESAKLLDFEAELIQSKLGRLPEDKMLLLSALLLGDKFRTVNSKFKALEEMRTEHKADNSGGPSSHENAQNVVESGDERYVASLEKISNMLDTLVKLQDLKGSSDEGESNFTEERDNAASQKSFI